MGFAVVLLWRSTSHLISLNIAHWLLLNIRLHAANGCIDWCIDSDWVMGGAKATYWYHLATATVPSINHFSTPTSDNLQLQINNNLVLVAWAMHCKSAPVLSRPSFSSWRTIWRPTVPVAPSTSTEVFFTGVESWKELFRNAICNWGHGNDG